ncbi:MAG: outer membrane beta-barrel protein [Planctomycetota bacterium]
MNVVKWTIGLAVIALGASPVLAQSAIHAPFNYELTGYCCSDEPSCGCDEPSCCCDEPSCCCEEPSCGCDDPCCGDEPSCCCDEPSCCCDDACCGDECGDDCCDCCDSCCSTCGLGGLSTPGCCCLGEPFDLGAAVLGDDAFFDMGGWLAFEHRTGPARLSAGGNDGLSFGDNPGGVDISQAWLYFERVADGSCGLDWGFRFDVMYGTDAQQTQAFGNDDPRWDFSAGFNNGAYGWALPQAYLEFASGDWSVIAGHFYTLIGYEVVTAPDNFFVSNALTMFNSEPFTHTGVLATYSGFEQVEFYGGWTLGWDTGFDQYTQNGTSGSSFLGGFSTSLTDDIAFTYITTFGDFGQRSDGATYGTAGIDDSAYSHSVVFDVAVSDSLNYVLQSDVVSVRDGVGHDQVGINQYLFYTINDCLALGTRIEWWKNEGDSFYGYTLGLNYRPHANLVIRPEVRFDDAASNAAATSVGFANESDYNNETFNIDAILTF